MTRTINEGDKVTIIWIEPSGPVKGTVMHVPQYAGDMWYFKSEDGTDFAINPACSELDSIYKERSDESTSMGK